MVKKGSAGISIAREAKNPASSSVPRTVRGKDERAGGEKRAKKPVSQGTARKFTGVITREKDWYVSHCLELGVVSQGNTIEEARANLKEAVELYLESFGGEDLPESVGEVVLYPFEVSVSG